MGRWFRPTSLDDALLALAEGGWTILAGGTDHFPARAGAVRDEDILDISALRSLRRIEALADGWFIPCGATWTDLIEADLPPLFDGLRAAARQIGGAQVQNRGTLVGNLCNASPAADGIPNLLALDARAVLLSREARRDVPVADFVLGNRRTARRPDELVTGLHIPAAPASARGNFLKLGARRYLVISIVMVASVLELEADGRVAAARIAVGACSAAARRLPALEAELTGRRIGDVPVRPDHLAPLSPIDDVRAGAGYRLQAARELLSRLLAAHAPERRAA